MGFLVLFILSLKHRVKYLKWLSLLGVCYQLLVELPSVIQPNRFLSYLSSISNILFVVLVLLTFMLVLFRREEYDTH